MMSRNVRDSYEDRIAIDQFDLYIYSRYRVEITNTHQQHSFHVVQNSLMHAEQQFRVFLVWTYSSGGPYVESRKTWTKLTVICSGQL